MGVPCYNYSIVYPKPYSNYYGPYIMGLGLELHPRLSWRNLRSVSCDAMVSCSELPEKSSDALNLWLPLHRFPSNPLIIECALLRLVVEQVFRKSQNPLNTPNRRIFIVKTPEVLKQTNESTTAGDFLRRNMLVCPFSRRQGRTTVSGVQVVALISSFGDPRCFIFRGSPDRLWSLKLDRGAMRPPFTCRQDTQKWA